MQISHFVAWLCAMSLQNWIVNINNNREYKYLASDTKGFTQSIRIFKTRTSLLTSLIIHFLYPRGIYYWKNLPSILQSLLLAYLQYI